MLYFFIRVIINALAVAFTVAALPGFTLYPIIDHEIGLLLTYIVAGALFGILNAFIRPVVLVLTGNLLITHMALVVIMTNSILMWLLEVLTPQWEVDNLLWVIPGGLIMGIVTFILEAMFGLDSPSFNEEDDPFYWRLLSRIPLGTRSRIVENMRLRRVYDTIWHYGVDIVFEHSPLARFRHLMQSFIYRRNPAALMYSNAAKVRLMLQELGPTYVKIGQMVSSRADALPTDWRTELELLQNNVPPFPYQEAQAIIEHDLGDKPEECFQRFEHAPLAAASTAQIHEAWLPTGEHVVVKVQRPDIVVKVRTDLNVMSDFVQFLEKQSAWAHENDVSGMLHEFGTNVMQELDYDNEAFNARYLAENMAELSHVRVPTIYPAYSSRRVLTMDFVKGVKITEVSKLDAAGVNRTELAHTFLKAILKQVLVDGFFHGDPHPGNVLVDTDTSDIIFIDTGMMGNLTSQQRLDFIDMLWSIHQQDAYGLARVAIKLSTPLRAVDEAALRRDVERMIQRYFVFGDAASVGLSKAMQETLNVAYRHGLRMNNELTIAIKAMIQAEEIIRALDNSLSIVQESFDLVKELMVEQVTVDNVVDLAMDQVKRLSREALSEVPTLADATIKWIQQYQKGRFALDVNVDTAKIDEQIGKLNMSISRMTTTLLMAGLIVGSAIATTVEHPDEWAGLSVVAFFVFMGSAIMGAYLALRMIFRNWGDTYF